MQDWNGDSFFAPARLVNLDQDGRDCPERGPIRHVPGKEPQAGGGMNLSLRKLSGSVFPANPGSGPGQAGIRFFNRFWTPAFAGVTPRAAFAPTIHDRGSFIFTT